MTTFSANLGYLWTELTLPDAIRAAAEAGFAAVECHWPYDVPSGQVRAALDETGLPMIGLNTRRGVAGQMGLTALAGGTAAARTAIDEAISYADAIDADAIHVMAGIAHGAAADEAFLENLAYATASTQRTILIEPLNGHDAPGYFLKSTDQARAIVERVCAPNLKIMFDCYHVGRTEGDVIARLTDLIPLIGHIQFASVPDRGPPLAGELDYIAVFAHLARLGWTRPIGAEYRPGGPTEDSLGWMRDAR